MPRLQIEFQDTDDAPRCPDCSGKLGAHDKTCSLARGMQFVIDADNAWHRRNPYMTGLFRALAPQERIYFNSFGMPIPDGAYVRVYWIRGERVWNLMMDMEVLF